ncbi:MAG TPA: DEAD/DEAH box helicase [Brevibacterium ravenspurgense]|nr:DEAD/DEAH box helicase [Brevibacterium ravenspurgense]
MTEQKTFADFGVSGPIVAALADHGITEPFPIQSMTLPIALGGADIIGQAQTGTGKTLGFGLPLLQRLNAPIRPEFAPAEGPTPEIPEAGRAPRGLVVAPTRELAQQVAGELATAAEKLQVKVVTIYGGRDYEPQIESLKAGADVVVGTPGRLLDLYGRRILKLSEITTVVLDEADEMLDLGFLPDVERIIAALPAQRQTMLFSATMPGAVVTMARRYMHQPTHIRAANEQSAHEKTANIKQFAYRAHAMDKAELVGRVLQSEGRGRTIIFAKTKRTADRLAEELTDRGFNARPLHGDLNQQARERALKNFRTGKTDVLVATDVAARGIDVEDVTHVINYQCPDDESTYIHRVGRTGRAGSTGIAITLIDWDDIPRWNMIARTLEQDLEAKETYSTSPHLFEEQNIPKGTKGRLPRAQSAKSERSGSGRGENRRSGRGERRRDDSKPPRPRRRTRGGKSVDKGSDAQKSDSAQQAKTSDGEAPKPRRRRRTRGGKKED